MTKDEALKLALEALERCVATCFDPYAHEQAMSWSEHFVNQTITAIKEALAQPEPWEKFCDSNCVWTDHHPDCKLAEQESVTWRNAAIRVGEDLCSVGPFGYYDMTAEQWLDWALSVVTVHAPPPQRLPLTDEVKDAARYRWIRDSGTDVSLVIDKRTEWVPPDDVVAGVGGYWMYEYRCGSELDEAIDRAIEAAHGIKGGA